MKKRILRILTFLILCTFSYTKAKPQNDPTLGWDWTQNSSFQEIGVIPWAEGNHYGVSLTESKRCPTSEGWYLYMKRFKFEDYPSKSISKGDKKCRFFILYNRNSGVIRTFYFIDGENHTSTDYFEVRSYITKNGVRYDRFGGFVNESPLSTSLTQKDIVSSNDINFVTGHSSYGKWLVFDHLITYDPSFKYDKNVFFAFDIISHDEAEVELAGTFEAKIGGSSSSSDLLSTISSAFNVVNGGQVKKHTDKLDGLIETLSSKGDELITKGTNEEWKWLKDIGNEFKSLSSSVKPFTGLLGPAMGAFEMISGLLNIGGGKNNVTYIKGTLELNGKIRNKSEENIIRAGVSGTKTFSDPINTPVFINTHNNETIGLYGISYVPEIKIKIDKVFSKPLIPPHFIYTLNIKISDDIKKYIHINPNTNKYLKSLKVQPIIIFKENLWRTNKFIDKCYGVTAAQGEFKMGNVKNFIDETSIENYKIGQKYVIGLRKYYVNDRFLPESMQNSTYYNSNWFPVAEKLSPYDYNPFSPENNRCEYRLKVYMLFADKDEPDNKDKMIEVVKELVTDKTEDNPTLPPSDLKPVNGYNNTSPINLSWNSKNAYSYDLQIATDNKFTNKVVNKRNYSTNSYKFNTSGYRVYYWRVRARNKGCYSRWSGTRYFYVKDPGQFDLTISGPKEVPFYGRGTWSANISGGTGTTTYKWFKNSLRGNPVGTSRYYSEYNITDPFRLYVKVTKGQISKVASCVISVYDTHHYPYGKTSSKKAESLSDAQQLANQNNYLISPNPSNGKFKIYVENLNNPFIEIYNSRGSLIESIKNIKSQTIFVDISNHPKGVYIVAIHSEQGIITKKILIQ